MSAGECQTTNRGDYDDVSKLQGSQPVILVNMPSDVSSVDRSLICISRPFYSLSNFTGREGRRPSSAR
jgi:hypothetical protein